MHYTVEEWSSYKNGKQSEDKRLQMEAHLDVCDECSALYLSLFNEYDLEAISAYIPDEFVTDVMDKLKQETRWVNKIDKKSKKTYRRSLLAYYLAAGILTLFLTGSGFFNTLGNLGNIVQYDGGKTDEEIPVSDQIAGNMNKWMNSFDNGNIPDIFDNGGDKE